MLRDYYHSVLVNSVIYSVLLGKIGNLSSFTIALFSEHSASMWNWSIIYWTRPGWLVITLKLARHGSSLKEPHNKDQNARPSPSFYSNELNFMSITISTYIIYWRIFFHLFLYALLIIPYPKGKSTLNSKINADGSPARFGFLLAFFDLKNVLLLVSAKNKFCSVGWWIINMA